MNKAKTMLSVISVVALISAAIAFKANNITNKVWLEYTNTFLRRCVTWTNHTTASNLGGFTITTPAGYFGFYTTSNCNGATAPFAYINAAE